MNQLPDRPPWLPGHDPHCGRPLRTPTAAARLPSFTPGHLHVYLHVYLHVEWSRLPPGHAGTGSAA